MLHLVMLFEVEKLSKILGLRNLHSDWLIQLKASYCFFQILKQTLKHCTLQNVYL